MKNLLLSFSLSFILVFSVAAQATDYKVLFKGVATDKRTNIVEPDIIFLQPNDKVIFNSRNVDLNKVVIIQVNRNGQFAEVDKDAYRELVDKSYLITREDYIYLYYSKQYYASGAFGLSIVGSFYKKQAEALKKVNYNQKFRDRVEHILKNLTPAD